MPARHAVLFLLFILFPLLAPGGPPEVRAQAGINLSGVSYWSTELAFVDLFKQSQPWQAQGEGEAYGQGGELAVSREGVVKWLPPGRYADSLLCRVSGHYPAGEYLCLYDGEGVIEFGFDAKEKRRGPGRVVLEVHPTVAGISVRLRKTAPENPLRNIRIIPPGFESSYEEKPFHPDFLKRWDRYQVIRFMDWMRTNNSKIENWRDRPTEGMQTQGGDRGVALEYMVQLANALKSDPWFCMPHKASHHYVRRFAERVKQGLDPGRKIYLEYSNETWNHQFEQAGYCTEMGLALGLSGDPFRAGCRFYAKRSVEIFRTWEEVFGGTERLVRVLAGQSGNPEVAREVLAFEHAFKNADALAIAPYFGLSLGNPDRASEVSGMTVDQVLSLCAQEIATDVDPVRRHRKLATRYGLDLVAYEGGQHLAGYQGAENNPALTRLFVEANRNPRMKTLYRQALTNWTRSGGGLFAAFASMSAYGKWGSWGLLEFSDQDPKSAPKYQALADFIREHAPREK